MDSTTQNQKLLVCNRAGIDFPAPKVPSMTATCKNCGRLVWVADSSPKDATPTCVECVASLSNDPEIELEAAGPTPEQKAEIEEYYRKHPEEKRNAVVEAFSSVTPEDLEGVEGLCGVIERLCSSLRDLRREDPKSFFGHPVEALYDSLEAALTDFYRSQVESTSSPTPSDPGAI